MQVMKKFEFEASHQLFGYLGDCRKLHGHSYHGTMCFLTGPLGQLGMGIDFKMISKVMDEAFVKVWDHVFLNNLFNINPTAEVMAMQAFLNCIQKCIDFGVADKVMPVSIVLHETRKCNVVFSPTMFGFQPEFEDDPDGREYLRNSRQVVATLQQNCLSQETLLLMEKTEPEKLIEFSSHPDHLCGCSK